MHCCPHKPRKGFINFIMFFCLSVRSRVSTPLRLDGFLWNWLLGTLMKIVWETSTLFFFFCNRTQTSGTVCECLNIFYFCLRHTFVLKSSANKNRELILAFPLQQRLRESLTVWRYPTLPVLFNLWSELWKCLASFFPVAKLIEVTKILKSTFFL